MAENAVEKETAEMNGMFKAVPDYILEELPGAEEWSGEAPPFNRCRRQIDKAKWGLVRSLHGGPPCISTSVCRPRDDGGPTPV